MKTPVRGPLGIDRVGMARLGRLRAGIHRAVVSTVWFVAAAAAIGAAQAAAPGIAVQGNQFVTTSAGTLGVKSVGANVPVVLRGVNIRGSDYDACTATPSGILIPTHCRSHSRIPDCR